MRRSLSIASAVATICAIGLVGACTTEQPASDEAAHTSCEGTTFFFDDGGRCHRADNGRFAPKVCCAPPAYPSKRRSLEAYTCPSTSQVDAVPIAFFDADSTLRVSKSGSPSANTAEDVYVLPFAARKIRYFNDHGWFVAVVSNQGGVANGFITVETAEAALVTTARLLHEMGGRVDYFDFAEAYDDNRKPKVGASGGTGMGDRLVAMLQDECGIGVAWDQTVMIGDAGYKKGQDDNHPWNDRPADDFSNSDRGFSLNMEIDFFEPAQQGAFGWDGYGVYNIHKEADLVALYGAIEAHIAELDQSGADPDLADELADEVALGRALNNLFE